MKSGPQFSTWLRRQRLRRDPVGKLARDYLAVCQRLHRRLQNQVEIRVRIEADESAWKRAQIEWRLASINRLLRD